MAAEQSHEDMPSSSDPHFEPIICLPEVEIKTLEEEEEEMFKMRAKLFRYASDADPPEWKERGVGDVKLLKHRVSGLIRLLMRRDKTLKICANHYLTKQMQLKPNIGSDRAWVWHVLADFADEVPKQELLAIRFANSENAQKFKAKFEECQNQISESKDSANKVADQLSQLTVTEESDIKEKAEQTTDVKDTNKEETESKTEEPKEETEQESTTQELTEQENKTQELTEQESKTQESKKETEQDSKSSSDVKTEETEGGGQSSDQL